MTITVVSRWKGDPQNPRLAKEIAPVLKKHGAVSVRLGFCTRLVRMPGRPLGRSFSPTGRPTAELCRRCGKTLNIRESSLNYPKPSNCRRGPSSSPRSCNLTLAQIPSISRLLSMTRNRLPLPGRSLPTTTPDPVPRLAAAIGASRSGIGARPRNQQTEVEHAALYVPSSLHAGVMGRTAKEPAEPS